MWTPKKSLSWSSCVDSCSVWNQAHFIWALFSFKCKCFLLLSSFFLFSFFFFLWEGVLITGIVKKNKIFRISPTPESKFVLRSKECPEQKTCRTDLHFFSLLITAPGWHWAPAEKMLLLMPLSTLGRMRDETWIFLFFEGVGDVSMLGFTSLCQNPQNSFQMNVLDTECM